MVQDDYPHQKVEKKENKHVKTAQNFCVSYLVAHQVAPANPCKEILHLPRQGERMVVNNNQLGFKRWPDHSCFLSLLHSLSASDLFLSFKLVLFSSVHFAQQQARTRPSSAFSALK